MEEYIMDKNFKMLADEPVAFVIQIPVREVDAPDLLDAFCTALNYQEMVDDPDNQGQTIPNPYPKKNFVEDAIGDYAMGVVRQHLINKASQEAYTIAQSVAAQRAAEINDWYYRIKEEERLAALNG